MRFPIHTDGLHPAVWVNMVIVHKSPEEAIISGCINTKQTTVQLSTTDHESLLIPNRHISFLDRETRTRPKLNEKKTPKALLACEF